MANKKITPPTIAPKWKYLGISIAKYVHNLYVHLSLKQQILMKERRPKQIEACTMFMD